MSELTINLVKSFLNAISTVLGGSLPIVILLFFLYKRIQEKHFKRANYQKEKVLPDLVARKKKEEQILSEWLGKVGGDEFSIFKNMEDDVNKAQLSILINQQRSRILRAETEIIKTEGDIKYVNNFDFWVFLEELLKSRYYQKDYYESRYTK